MIIDSLKNQTLYPYGETWAKAFAFLRTVTPELEAGCYDIIGDDVYANVNFYETKPRTEAQPEDHQRYIDVQVMISGSETFEIFPKNSLRPAGPYDTDRDLQFYRLPEEPAPIRFTLTPGQFAVFFPEDVHMPGLNAGDSEKPVQKVVIKIRADLLR